MAIKEADQIRTKSQKTNLFQSADYKRLWNSILENDIKEWKSVGKKLMKFIMNLSKMCVLASPLGEQIGEDQNIAAKFHCDQSYFQRPIQAGCSIRDALNQFNLESDRHRILYMGIELDLETDLGDLEKISYPDTFVHLVLQPV